MTMRPIIQAFAAAMEAKLAENDAVKGEWRGDSPFALIEMLDDERIELRDMVIGGSPMDVLLEACDVALYAMMIADVCGALPATTDRGRVLAAS